MAAPATNNNTVAAAAIVLLVIIGLLGFFMVYRGGHDDHGVNIHIDNPFKR